MIMINHFLSKAHEAKSCVEKLKHILKNKGVAVGEKEKLSELVDHIDFVEHLQKVEHNITYLTSNSEVFKLEGFTSKPLAVGVTSEDLRNAVIYGSREGFVVPSLLAEFPADAPDDTEMLISETGCNARRTKLRDKWSVEFSFAEANANLPTPTYFQGGYKYTWAVWME